MTSRSRHDCGDFRVSLSSSCCWCRSSGLPSRLRGARIDSMSDHRIAMSFAIAGLAADGETVIDGAEWADISFPGFFELLSQLSDRAVSVSGVERGAHARDK